jgi:hypothetical protein
MQDNTDHNKLADQMAARLREEFVATRLNELASFEKQASGEKPRKSKRAAAPAPVRPSSRGIMGKQGAGKTKTAGKVAIGLVQHLKEARHQLRRQAGRVLRYRNRLRLLIPDFEAAGIPLVVAKSKTLKPTCSRPWRWAEENCSALIIDSITHPYRELIAAYLKKKKRTFLQIDDWNYLKGDYGWAQFTERYINSKLHIIMCGRAGDDLEQYVDENGKRQLEKSAPR